MKWLNSVPSCSQSYNMDVCLFFSTSFSNVISSLLKSSDHLPRLRAQWSYVHGCPNQQGEPGRAPSITEREAMEGAVDWDGTGGPGETSGLKAWPAQPCYSLTECWGTALPVTEAEMCFWNRKSEGTLQKYLEEPTKGKDFQVPRMDTLVR